MRVLFPEGVKAAGAGKSFFLRELSREFTRRGIEVVFEGKRDIEIHPIRFKSPRGSAPRILRIDGVYHNTAQDWVGKNKNVASSASEADGVVCQSEFSLVMCRAYLKLDPSKTVIIHNGADLNQPVGQNPYQPGTFNFVACAKWRPHKRLNEVHRAFLAASVPNWRLWVIGHVEEQDMIKDDSIFYLGYIDDRPKLMSYFKYATASLHLCWFDACPNSVVEAIAQKCPVICNNVGGTRELVGPSGGCVLNLDAPYDYAPIDLYHPKPVDSNLIVAAMRDCTVSRPLVNNSYVDINLVADKYLAFMEKFL